ncbi:MAG: lipase family protein [Sphingobacteriales bacterium]|nr:lipase family protein [Sphingobacteriales bacterium]
MRTLILSFLLAVSLFSAGQQKLQPGLDPREYADLLSITFHGSSIPDSLERQKVKDPYQLEFLSPEMGLLNQWSLYRREDNVGVINIRGTVNKAISWMANFYAPMIPATGSLQLNDSTVFNYQLADNPAAAVHAGWTIALGHLAPGIIEHIRQLYHEKGTREFYVFGHSQGGAIAYLLRSYLYYEQKKGTIPGDISFKTYCSAAPKPGNLYYAYDYDYITRGGWALTVVNASDWVPESPFSIQTIRDFNPVNPLINVKPMLKKQKFLVRTAGGIIYDKLERKTRKAQRKFEKYLGHTLFKTGIRKALPQLKEPVYVHVNNYMRAGTPVVLLPDEGYRQLFPDDKNKAFIHHMFAPYYYLLKKIYGLK